MKRHHSILKVYPMIIHYSVRRLFLVFILFSTVVYSNCLITLRSYLLSSESSVSFRLLTSQPSHKYFFACGEKCVSAKCVSAEKSKSADFFHCGYYCNLHTQIVLNRSWTITFATAWMSLTLS